MAFKEIRERRKNDRRCDERNAKGEWGRLAMMIVRWTAYLVVALGLLMVGVTSIAFIGSIILPQPVTAAAATQMYKLALGDNQKMWCQYGWSRFVPMRSQACQAIDDPDTSTETSIAWNRDHLMVESWVNRCFPLIQFQDLRSDQELAPTKMDIFRENPVLRSILDLSSRIADDRVFLAGSIKDAERSLSFWTWATVLAGFFTTALLGLSATDNVFSTGTSGKLRGAALVSTALGTAVSVLVAFYSPREQVSKQNTAIAGLQRLHVQFGGGMNLVACPPDKGASLPKGWTTAEAKYEDLLTRYTEVKAASSASSDQSSSGRSSGGSSPTQGPPSPGAPKAGE